MKDSGRILFRNSDSFKLEDERNFLFEIILQTLFWFLLESHFLLLYLLGYIISFFSILLQNRSFKGTFRIHTEL